MFSPNSNPKHTETQVKTSLGSPEYHFKPFELPDPWLNIPFFLSISGYYLQPNNMIHRAAGLILNLLKGRVQSFSNM